MCVRVYVGARAWVCGCVHMCVRVCVCVCVCVGMRACVCICKYQHGCTYIRMCVFEYHTVHSILYLFTTHH